MIARPLVAILDEYIEDLEQVGRIAAAAMSNRVVTANPVLTGSSRASWNASIGSPSPGDVTIDDGGRNYRHNYSEVVNRLNLGDRFFLANGKPYINLLENGYSAKAPLGMVFRSAAKWQSEVDEAVNQRNRLG